MREGRNGEGKGSIRVPSPELAADHDALAALAVSHEHAGGESAAFCQYGKPEDIMAQREGVRWGGRAQAPARHLPETGPRKIRQLVQSSMVI